MAGNTGRNRRGLPSGALFVKDPSPPTFTGYQQQYYYKRPTWGGSATSTFLNLPIILSYNAKKKKTILQLFYLVSGYGGSYGVSSYGAGTYGNYGGMKYGSNYGGGNYYAGGYSGGSSNTGFGGAYG